VERALTLVSTGTLTVAMAHNTKSKNVTLPRTLNPSTGKDSMRQTGFSDTVWGETTREYSSSIRALANTKFDAIVKEAEVFKKRTRASNKTSSSVPTQANNVDAGNKPRACLVDNSDSDSDVINSFLSTNVTVTNMFFQDSDRAGHSKDDLLYGSPGPQPEAGPST
jgi:hypothetical protein